MRRRCLISRGFAGALALSALAAPSFGAIDPGSEARLDEAVAAMEIGNWPAALDLLERATSGESRTLFLRYGPRFGAAWYRRGLCEMKLKRWREAARSFEICYRDFPNPPGIDPAVTGNSFQKKALLKWAEAAMGAEEWRTAITLFQKFRSERNRDSDVFPQGAYYVNLAVCHYKLREIPEGSGNFEIALQNRDGFPTPVSSIQAGLQALVEAAIAKRNEPALHDFLTRNRGDLSAEPAELAPHVGLDLKLAADLTDAGMFRAGMELYQMVPDTARCLEDLRAGGAPDPEDEEPAGVFAALEKASGEGASSEVIKQRAIAELHERCGHVPGAFAARLRIERLLGGSAPKSVARGDNLRRLVRAAVLAGKGEAAGRYGTEFLAVFPKGPEAEEMRGLLQSLPPSDEAPPVIACPEPEVAKASFPATNRKVESGGVLANLVTAQGMPRKILVLGLKNGSVRFRGVDKDAVEGAFPLASVRSLRLQRPPDVATALRLFRGRRCVEALALFRAAGVRYAGLKGLEGNPCGLVAFHELECLRRLGDLDGLAAAAKAYGTEDLSADQRRQLEIDLLWEKIRTKDWHGAEELSRNGHWSSLPGDLEAQVAWCRGLALEGLGRGGDALEAYAAAMTAEPAGDSTRPAALRALRLYLAVPAVREAVAGGHAPEGEDASSSIRILRDAVALATCWEMALGGGQPLPEELRGLVKPVIAPPPGG